MKKTIITTIIMLVSVFCFAQKKNHPSSLTINSFNSFNYFQFPAKGDTLVLSWEDFKVLHYLQIGENVYKIESPVLTKIDPFPGYRLLIPNVFTAPVTTGDSLFRFQ